MNNAFGRPRKSRRQIIDITSLIDVMFLLLIFFMVSTVFRNSTGIDITLPSASTASDLAATPYEIFVQESGAITFREREGISLEELERQMRALLAEEPGARLALSADANADYAQFVAVIDLARKVGGEQLIIRTERDPESADTVEKP